jgi:hypothetical protein
MIRPIVPICFVLLSALPLFAEDFQAGPIPEKLRQELKLADFYQKYVATADLPVVGSKVVTDQALAEAAWIVRQMLAGREDIIKAMRESRVRVVVMAATEYTTDVPEHSRLKTKQFWDRRARGLGATPSNPAVSCGEENLLDYPGDPYPNENIFVHEFAHAIHGTGMNKVDPTFDRRLREAFEKAKERKLWVNTYAATNRSEYWAEGVQCWFDDNAPDDSLHNDIRTRKQLLEYDPDLAKLCKEVFGDNDWRYLRPTKRKPADRAHLTDYDPAKLPRFRWRDAPLIDKPLVTLDTAAGEIVVECDAKASPEAVRNFLAIALNGGYHSGKFVSADSGWLRATSKPKWLDQNAKRINLDGVPVMEWKPIEGSVVWIRDGSGLGDFAIAFEGSAKRLDNAVPIGRVTKGMELAKKIAASKAEKGLLVSPVDLRRVIRTE